MNQTAVLSPICNYCKALNLNAILKLVFKVQRIMYLVARGFCIETKMRMPHSLKKGFVAVSHISSFFYMLRYSNLCIEKSATVEA